MRYQTLYPQATGQWRIRRFNCILAVELRKGHSAGKPLPQLAIREDAICFSKLYKKLFFANKDPKTDFDAWMILQKPALSFKCNDLKKNCQFEGDIIFCHRNLTNERTQHTSIESRRWRKSDISFLQKYTWPQSVTNEQVLLVPNVSMT